MIRRRIGAVVLLAALLAGCGAPAEDVTSASATTTQPAGEGWEQLPTGPLSPRAGAVLVTLDDGRLLVVGGDSFPGCHDMVDLPADEPGLSDSGASAVPIIREVSAADCSGPERETRLRDGAILNASNEWRPIAEAPVPLAHPTRGVVIGQTVYFWSWPRALSFEDKPTAAWVAYDTAADSWARLPDPMVGDNGPAGLVRAEERLIAFHTTDEHGERPDSIYDPSSGAWTDLPNDPLPPSFDRMMVWTGSGVGLLGRDAAALNEPNRPPLRAAIFDLREQTWQALGEGGVSHGNVTWEWALATVVNAPVAGEDPALGSALPSAPSIPPGCEHVHPPEESPDGESASGDVRLGDWTLNVPPETNGTTSCNPKLAKYALSSAWAFGGVVAFGGYDTVAEPGQTPTDYKFKNEAWLWRPNG